MDKLQELLAKALKDSKALEKDLHEQGERHRGEVAKAEKRAEDAEAATAKAVEEVRSELENKVEDLRDDLRRTERSLEKKREEADGLSNSIVQLKQQLEALLEASESSMGMREERWKKERVALEGKYR